VALERAGSRARGATVYVNLEPCCHWGKTPPCTEALKEAGVRRVVAAVRDPNSLVAGRGLRELKRRGIRVDAGVLEREAAHLNRAFFKWIRTGIPYVTIKTAMTLDGKICTTTGASRWISGPAARRWVHELRARVDAVAVGANTALRDNPALTAHGAGRNPLRVVIDSRLSLKPSARLFNKEAPTILATTLPAARKAGFLRKKGVTLVACRAGKDGQGVNLKELLKTLGKMFISHLLVEGGGSLNASLVENRLVDEIFVIVAPKIFGGAGRSHGGGRRGGPLSPGSLEPAVGQSALRGLRSALARGAALMFTGIVRQIGSIESTHGHKLRLRTRGLKLRLGGSVAVNGVCLTVCGSRKNGRNELLEFDTSEETLSKTALGRLGKGDAVNIETPLTLSTPVGGHFVTGHVEGVGHVKKILRRTHSAEVWFSAPKPLLKYIAPKGSIAVDGVSLTVVDVKRNDFSVSLIPFTLRHTRLGRIKPGGAVNLETDLLAKYVESVNARPRP